MKKYTVHEVLLHFEPSKQINECNKQLRELLPTLSDCHRLLVASWWCGVTPTNWLYKTFGMGPATWAHKVFDFVLHMKVDCATLDFHKQEDQVEAAE